MEMINPTRESAREQLRKQQLIELGGIMEDHRTLFDDSVLPVVALAPYLPVELADKLETDLSTTLTEAEAEGVISSEPGPRPWIQPVYSMASSTSKGLLDDLQRRKQPGFLTKELARSARVLRESGGGDLETEP